MLFRLGPSTLEPAHHAAKTLREPGLSPALQANTARALSGRDGDCGSLGRPVSHDGAPLSAGFILVLLGVKNGDKSCVPPIAPLVSWALTQNQQKLTPLHLKKRKADPASQLTARAPFGNPCLAQGKECVIGSFHQDPPIRPAIFATSSAVSDSRNPLRTSSAKSSFGSMTVRQ